MRISDWSSDVCSSDLDRRGARVEQVDREHGLLRRLVAHARVDVDARDHLCLELRIAGVGPKLCIERRGAVLRRGYEQRDIIKLDRRIGQQVTGAPMLHPDRKTWGGVLQRGS